MASIEVLREIDRILHTKWQPRKGRIVPTPAAVALSNQAVELEGAVLYADLVDSTGLVEGYQPWFAAAVYKSYLLGACRVIKDEGGSVTAFDGDRVMGVFVGESQNSTAARASLKINFLVIEVNKLLKRNFPNSSYELRHTIGIDSGNLFVAKSGVRNANDLVWVGKAANVAAKLCSLGSAEYPTHITDGVFRQLAEDAKYGGNPRSLMWEKRVWTARGDSVVYRSNWWWRF